MMGTSCILLRFSPKEATFACGNARNVTLAAPMRSPRTDSEKRWEPELCASLPRQIIKKRQPLTASKALPTAQHGRTVLDRQQTYSPSHADNKRSALATVRPPSEIQSARAAPAATSAL